MTLRSSQDGFDQMDDMTLDVRLIRSCIEFLNEDLEVEMSPDRRCRHFDWVTGAITERVKVAGLSPKHFSPVPFAAPPPTTNLQILCAKFKVAFSSLQQRSTLDDFDQGNLSKWINKVLKNTVIYQVVRAQGLTAQRISIPRLATIEQCLTYTLASLLEDRWGLLERIRACPFYFGKTQYHWFLDYRVDESGRLQKAQQFCCPEHANRYRQHHYRQRQKKVREPR